MDYIMCTNAIALLILSAVNILVVTETDIRNITEGERFELKCSTTLQYPVVWHFRQSDGTHELFFGNKVSMKFSSMFRLTGNQSLGEYNLLIPSADGRYAGNYKCIDDDGMGSELISIQINILSGLISTRPTYMAPIASHSIIDAADYEAPKEAASRSENNKQAISIAIPVVVCFVALSMVIAIIVAVQRWRSKRERNGDDNNCCPEARPSSNPDSVETSKRVKTSSESSDSSTNSKKLDVFANPPLVKEHDESDAENRDSSLPYTAHRSRFTSESSAAPLLTEGGERTP